MDTMEIGKAAAVGGVVAVAVEFIVGAIASAAAYDFSFIAMLLAGFLAGWMLKGKMEDAVVGGAVADLVYIILGIYIIYPLFGHAYTGGAIGLFVVGIILGAIGGFAGNYLSMGQKPKSSTKKR